VGLLEGAGIKAVPWLANNYTKEELEKIYNSIIDIANQRPDLQ